MVLLFIIVLLWTFVIYFILWHMRFVFCLKILGKNTILVPTFCGHYSLSIWLLNLGSSQFGLSYFHLQSIWSLHFGNSQIGPCYFQFTVDLVIIIFKITVILGTIIDLFWLLSWYIRLLELEIGKFDLYFCVWLPIKC